MQGKNMPNCNDADFLKLSEQIRERASLIKLVLMDVDGVLTNGELFYCNDTEGKVQEFKAFNSHDGLGLHFLRMVGIKTGVISGRISVATTERARILDMSYVYQGHLAKIPIFEEILAKEGLTAESVAFIGDDFTDVPLIRRCGLGCATANARPEVKQAADFVTELSGGAGAVREVVELILKSNGRWEEILAKYELEPAAVAS